MKHFFFFSLVLLLAIPKANAQKNAPPSVTFDVCDVQQKPTVFPLTPYKSAVDQMCSTGVEAWSSGTDSVIYSDINPFVATVREAYLNHRPLVLTPDMIWLLIAQGFAIHVDQNSDSLRKMFVDFDGKKVLKVERDEFVKGSPMNDWQGVFPEFTKQIGENTGQQLLNTTLADFTTTTPTTKAACEVTLMDAMSSYFIYAVYTIGCGIPKITLEGTTADWERLRTKALELRKYKLEWWIDELKPALDEFVDASKGEVNRDFWSKIYDVNYRQIGGGCGGPTTVTEVTGWILKFFPYQSSGEKFVKRSVLTTPLDPHDFTKGLAKADFYWYYAPDGESPIVYQMEFIAGFMGTKLDRKTGALSPEIGWAIRDSGKEGIKDDDKKYEKDIMTPPANGGR